MQALQKSTAQQKPTTDDSSNVDLVEGITLAQDAYVAFVALGGLIPDVDADHTAVKMTATQFANKIKVDRTTLYLWRKTIPDFWDRVNAKRKEIGGKDRLSVVWSGVFLKAAAGNAEAAKLYLANFDPDFRMPMQKHELDIGDGLAEAMKLARMRRGDDAIEGEVIDAPKPTDAAA